MTIHAEDHFGLVAQLVLRYRRLKQNERVEDTEEFSDGLVGLSQAIQRFNPAMGYEFSTFAWYCIRNAIWNGCKRRRPHEVYCSPMSNWDNFEEFEHGYETPEYVDDLVEKLKVWLVVSPDDPEHLVRRKFVLHEVFYNERTLKDISDEMHLTRERVRQLKEDGVEFLREKFHAELHV